MSACPCGSGQPLTECCRPIIDGEQKARTADTLMRARYTAHTTGDMAFILATHHPSTRNDIDEAATSKWARESEWQGLEIIDTDGGTEDDSTGRVEFIARYRDPSRNRHTHHERAVFEKYHGQWYFRDAEIPDVNQYRRETPKQGRNDPCACGSGKKYKKCCGKA